jgi:peptidoglycan/LPS O-acetylase OafA/YrhL
MTTRPVDRPAGKTNNAMNSVRFLAAFVVVLFHLRTLFIEDFGEAADQGVVTMALYAVMSLGHQAVIVFFVLSGYWVGGSVISGLRRGTFSVASYSSARLVRLWLVLLPALVLTFALDSLGRAVYGSSDIYAGSAGYHSLLPEEGIAAHTSWSTAFGNATFLQDIYAPTFGSNSPLWSLAAEFWYYLAFPAALVLAWRSVSSRARLLSAGVLGGAVAVVALGPAGGGRVFELAPTWALGAAVAALRPVITTRMARFGTLQLLTVRVVLGILVLGAAVVDSRAWSTPTTYALALITALWLASLIMDVQSTLARRVLAPTSWAAEWSYSLYATHLPVLALLAAVVVPSVDDRWALTPLTALGCLALTAAPLGVALLFYVALERNTKSVLRGIRGRKARVDGHLEPAGSSATTVAQVDPRA